MIIGGTGEGKTGLAAWLLARFAPSPMIIYDTKEEKKFRALPNSIVVDSWDAVIREIDNVEHDYIIFDVPAHIADDPATLNEFLMEHYERFHGVPAYIDELYSFHSAGRPGRGLHALLTRGRGRGISLIMGTQRPAWISLFCLSESQAFYILGLGFEDDRKRVQKVVRGYADLPEPGRFEFYYYRKRDPAPVLFKPVTLDKGIDTGYTVGIHSQNRTDKPEVDAIELHHWL